MLNLAPATPQFYPESLKVLKEYPYFRTDYFEKKIDVIIHNIKKIANAKNYNVKLLTTSGTGVMDCAINNFINKQKDKVLVIVGGRFGIRWRNMLKYYDINFNSFIVEYGRDIDLKKLKNVIKKTKYDFILMQHNETETMQLFDIKRVADICKKNNIRLVVDASSSFAIDNIDMKNWNIDVLVFGTQKGLNTNPGLGVVIFKNDMKIVKGNFYFDLDKYNNNDYNFSLPFTPNLLAIDQVLVITDKILKTKWYKKINSQANHFRILIKNLGFKPIAQTNSNCGTVIRTKRSDNKKFFEYLCKKDIYFCPSGGRNGDEITISHIGNLTKKDNLIFLKELEKWLTK